ncbi:diguanylate cyclase [Actinotalea ferrariae CF5-4]|uniref:Diguanylate cyclase n=1 Tax=Actinotalea ferrariae CF5-4 TaxID=948458 RepID=A0A021VSY7_9CELL|nr:diguanylate cyclase [Actinotalea ferrariae CF5-4]
MALDAVDGHGRRHLIVGVLAGVPVMGALLVARGAEDPHVLYGYPPIMVGLLLFAWVLARRPHLATTATRITVLALDGAWLVGIATRLGSADDAATAWASLFPLSFMGIVVFLVLGFLDRSSRAAVVHGAGLITATLVVTAAGLSGLPGGSAYVVDLLRYGAYLTVVLVLLHLYSRWKDRLVDATAAAERAHATAAHLRDLAYVDELTGLANRRRVLEELTFQATRVAEGQAVSVVYFDLDRFKAVNDARGHATGDAVLRAVAAAATTVVRQGDVLGRLGGEEFVVVAPGTDRDQAVQLAERLREALPQAVLRSVGLRVTASFGVSVLRPRESPESVLGRVDELMYQAKDDGRDRVSSAH